MEKELASGLLGIVSYKLGLKAGKLALEVSVEAIDGAIAVVKKVKEIIPGKIDDVLLDGVIASLEALK